LPLATFSLFSLVTCSLATVLMLYDGSPTCEAFNGPYEYRVIEEYELDTCIHTNTSHIYSVHLEFLAPAVRCHFFAFNATTDPENICAPNPLANITTFATRGPCFKYPGFRMTALKITCDLE